MDSMGRVYFSSIEIKCCPLWNIKFCDRHCFRHQTRMQIHWGSSKVSYRRCLVCFTTCLSLQYSLADGGGRKGRLLLFSVHFNREAISDSFPLSENCTRFPSVPHRSPSLGDEERRLKNTSAKTGLVSKIPASNRNKLHLTFFVLKIESGYIFLWNMIGIHT